MSYPYQKHTWVTKEIIRREYLQNIEDGIYDEQQHRLDAESGLQDNIDAEATTRSSADDTLQDNIDAEETRAIGVEQGLQDQIDSNDTDISSLDTRISNEYTRATTAEAGLRTYVDDTFITPTDYATTSTGGAVKVDGTTITINNGVVSAHGGHTITDGTTSYTQRANLQFSNCTITDDATNDATIVSANGSAITVDSALSTTSTNPVQNAVITNDINALDSRMDIVEDDINNASTGLKAKLATVDATTCKKFTTVSEMISADLSTGAICETSGFSTVNDGGAGKYVITEETANGLTILAMNNGKSASLVVDGELNVLQVGFDNTFTNDNSDKFNNLVSLGYNLYFPTGEYKFENALTIAGTAMNEKVIRGELSKNTILRFAEFPAVTIESVEVVIKDLGFHPYEDNSENIPTITGNYYETAYIKNGIADSSFMDFSLEVYNCHFVYNNCALWLLTRNAKVKDCVFYSCGMGDYANIYWDFPTGVPTGENSTDRNAFDNMQTAKRCLIVDGNRTHFTRGYLVDNTGYNSVNSHGLHIVNNYVESSLLMKGYLNDAIVTNNHAFMLDTVRPWIDCSGAKDTVISNNEVTGNAPYDNGTVQVDGAYPSTFFKGNGAIENVALKNNILSNNTRNYTYWFLDNVKSLKIEDIINNCKKSVPVLYFDGTGKTVDNIDVKLIASKGDYEAAVGWGVYSGASGNTYNNVYCNIITDAIISSLASASLKNKCQVMDTVLISGVGNSSAIDGSKPFKVLHIAVFSSNYNDILLASIPYSLLSASNKIFHLGDASGFGATVTVNTASVEFTSLIQSGSSVASGGALSYYFDI